MRAACLATASRPGLRRTLALLVGLGAALVAAQAAAQVAGPPAPPPAPEPVTTTGPVAPPLIALPKVLVSAAEGVGASVAPDTPRSAVAGYLRAARAGRWSDAAGYLDLSEVPDGERAEAGPQLARRLKVVLDRKLWIDTSALSPLPGGDPDDGLPAGVDRVGGIEADGVTYEINVWRREPEPGRPSWMFTPGTLLRLEPLDEAYGRGPLADYIPDWAVRLRFLEAEAWQWAGLVALGILAFLVAVAFGCAGVRVARAVTRRTPTSLDDAIVEALHRPLVGMAAIALLLASSGILQLSVRARAGLVHVASLLWVGLVAWAVLRLVDRLLQRLTDRMVEQGRTEALATLALARRAVKATVVVLAVLAGLQQQGVNITGLLAGLGIAGIAVSLAAQKTLENVFGGIVLSTDHPVRVGDFCRFGTQSGVVEDIGLRSTRVRTLDRTVISVPNAELSTVQIENFALRDKIRFATTLNLRYETTPDQMRFVLARLRELLVAHPRVDPEGLRVRFAALGAASLDVEVIAYVATREFDEFTAIREDILLRIVELVAEGGTGFAFPSQTLYLRRDDGLDRAAAAGAEDRVRQWRESGRLPFPTMPADVAERIRGTLDYPPRGSGSAPASIDRHDSES